MNKFFGEKSEGDIIFNPGELAERSEVERIGGEGHSKEGAKLMEAFMHKLHEKYPDRDYYELDSELIGGDNNISYVTYNQNGEVSGVLNGEEQGSRQFKIHWFVVDPEYQESRAAEKLWSKVSSEFDRIRLWASIFGVEKNATEKQRMSRQKALIKYYERLGFRSETGSSSSNLPGGGMSMVWEKEK